MNDKEETILLVLYFVLFVTAYCLLYIAAHMLDELFKNHCSGVRGYGKSGMNEDMENRLNEDIERIGHSYV